MKEAEFRSSIDGYYLAVKAILLPQRLEWVTFSEPITETVISCARVKGKPHLCAAVLVTKGVAPDDWRIVEREIFAKPLPTPKLPSGCVVPWMRCRHAEEEPNGVN